jgi:DNA-3-methyladenine glycosylase
MVNLRNHNHPRPVIRALQPVRGIATMARHRGVPESSSARMLTGGPGKLCQALGITRKEDHDIDVTLPSSHIQVLDDSYRPNKVVATPRIGITKAMDLPLRFLIAANETKLSDEMAIF